MSAPEWSVIVPTWNRPQRLAECVAALARIEPPAGGFEIVVVNDGGTGPDAVVHRHAADAAVPLRVLTQANAGPGAARNHGARMAAGRWLAFTDDDCRPEPGWLRAYERALAARPDALAGGTVVNALTDNIFSETSQLLAAFVTHWFDGTGGRERFFTSNNVAVSRDAFAAAGGFDETFGTLTGEDREFCDRWHGQGRPTLAVDDAVVRHAHLLSPRSFLAQHAAYGRGAVLFRRIRRAGTRPVRVDGSFYIASLRHAGRVRPLRRGLALAGLTAAAHAAYLAGLAYGALRHRLAPGSVAGHAESD